MPPPNKVRSWLPPAQKTGGLTGTVQAGQLTLKNGLVVDNAAPEPSGGGGGAPAAPSPPATASGTLLQQDTFAANGDGPYQLTQTPNGVVFLTWADSLFLPPPLFGGLSGTYFSIINTNQLEFTSAADIDPDATQITVLYSYNPA